MISVTQASTIIQSNLFSPRKETIEIEQATGRILAETIYADRDFPPFDRATMDGIAIDAKAVQVLVREDTNQGNREDTNQGQNIKGQTFLIEGIQAAGQPAGKLSSKQNCFEIMTGALLPEGANTVVRYEDVEIVNGKASLKISSVSEGDNIHFKGMDAKENDALIEPGTKLSAAEIALLASVGKAQVEVFSYPTIAIVSTGDELVSIHKRPLPYQIRTSNAYALQAALAEMGCTSNRFLIADNEAVLTAKLQKIISQHDVILLSGGVSKGKFDFVPTVLKSLGIKKLFHQVSQKPGKPIWFGRSNEIFVFALPGNPVSTFMCFHRYIKPWLLTSMGSERETLQAILAKDSSFKPALTYFLQVKVVNEEGKLMAYPIAGGGSGDFINLKEVDGFLELPPEQNEFKAGEAFAFIRFR